MTSNFLRRSQTGQEHWKRSKRYPEFEVSNLGKVRKLGERQCVEPYFDNANKIYRVKLKTVNGDSTVNLANLVAECYIGERRKNQRVIHKNGNVADNTAYNLDYEYFRYHVDKPKTGTPVQIAAPDADVIVHDGSVLPRYVVLDVGALVMTATLPLAREIAALQRLDIYEIEQRGDGDNAVWVLGKKVD